MDNKEKNAFTWKSLDCEERIQHKDIIKKQSSKILGDSTSVATDQKVPDHG